MSTQIRGDFSSRERDFEDLGIFRFTSSSSALHPFLMILYFPLHALSRAVINCENTSVLITIIHQSLKHTYCLQTKQMCTKLQWGGDNLHLITQSYNQDLQHQHLFRTLFFKFNARQSISILMAFHNMTNHALYHHDMFLLSNNIQVGVCLQRQLIQQPFLVMYVLIRVFFPLH